MSLVGGHGSESIQWSTIQIRNYAIESNMGNKSSKGNKIKNKQLGEMSHCYAVITTRVRTTSE